MMDKSVSLDLDEYSEDLVKDIKFDNLENSFNNSEEPDVDEDVYESEDESIESYVSEDSKNPQSGELNESLVLSPKMFYNRKDICCTKRMSLRLIPSIDHALKSNPRKVNFLDSIFIPNTINSLQEMPQNKDYMPFIDFVRVYSCFLANIW